MGCHPHQICLGAAIDQPGHKTGALDPMAYIAQSLEISETTLALKKQAVSCQKGTLPRGEGRNMPFSSDTRGWKL